MNVFKSFLFLFTDFLFFSEMVNSSNLIWLSLASIIKYPFVINTEPVGCKPLSLIKAHQVVSRLFLRQYLHSSLSMLLANGGGVAFFVALGGG